MDVVNGTGGVTQFSHNVTVNTTDTLRAYNASVDHLGDKVKQEERMQSNATTVFFEGAVNPADRTRSIVDVYWKVPGARAVLISLKKKPITPQSAGLAINVTIPSPYTLMPTPSTFNATLLTLPSGNTTITTGPVMLNSTGVECTGNGSCWFVVMFDVMGCQITGQYRFTLTPACRPSAAGCKPPPAFGAILSLGSSPFCGAPISAQSSAGTLIRSDSTYTIARTDNKFTFGNTAYFLVILDTLNPDFIIQNARLVAINRTNMEDTCAGVTWDLSQNTTSINQTFNADIYPPTLTFGVKMDKNATCAVAGKTQVTVNFTFVIEVTYEDGIYTGLPPLPGLVPGGMSTQPATEPIPATTNQNGPTDAGSQSTAPAAPTGTGPATTSGAPARRRREITLGNIYANSATEVTYSDGDLKSLDDLVNGLLDSMGLGNDTNTTTGSSSGADSATSTSDTASSAASSAGGETSSGSAAPTSSDAAGNGTAGGGSNSTSSAKNGTADGKKPSAPAPAGGTAAANASTGPVDLMVPATWGDLEWKIVYATSALLAVACVWCCCTNCIACIWNSQTKHTKKKNKVVRKQQHPSQVAFMAQSSDEAALLAHRQSMGQVPQYGGQYY